ncbi:MAG: GntR family transcriptional regulator [Anaerolineales bacterium]
MKIDLPLNLQRRFEAALRGSALERGVVWSPAALSERFEVPEEEMRQVLAVAHRKGLVARMAEDRFRILGIADRGVKSVHAHTQKQALRPSSQVRGVSVEPASREVAEQLAVEIGAPIYRFERTRCVQEVPLANQMNYLPLTVCPGLENHDVSQRSFQALLEEEYAVVLTDAVERLTMVPATAQDASVLGIPPDARVLEIARLALSATAQPVVWAILHINPQGYRYVAEIWPTAVRLLDRDQSPQ